ncbi:hypothetical protein GCM10009610_47770 [Pseudonocardia xinjiangensis]
MEGDRALRRTLFRSRIWRPALVRAGMLGAVVPDGDAYLTRWSDTTDKRHGRQFITEPAATKHVAHEQAGGLVSAEPQRCQSDSGLACGRASAAGSPCCTSSSTRSAAKRVML